MTNSGKLAKNLNHFSLKKKQDLFNNLKFLENEFSEIDQIKKITWVEYAQDSFKRKIIERWIENLVMVVLDIAKIVLASEKKNIPQSYRETLKIFTTLYVDSRIAEKFSHFAELRNIIVHEYLDIRWKRIENFIKEGSKLYPLFIEKVKKITAQ
ncbi:MAG: HepT-like ribonuclease domain-containing protein [bacterium]